MFPRFSCMRVKPYMANFIKCQATQNFILFSSPQNPSQQSTNSNCGESNNNDYFVYKFQTTALFSSCCLLLEQNDYQAKYTRFAPKLLRIWIVHKAVGQRAGCKRWRFLFEAGTVGESKASDKLLPFRVSARRKYSWIDTPFAYSKTATK